MAEQRAHTLHGANKFKLGIFSANADGGLAFSTVPERWTAGWDDNVTAAQIADRAGIEFFLPIARWRGYGGAMKVREWSFETFTWAAGLAALTERMAIFMTVHVPLVHPIYAAKALATVDHISHGRAGLNIVCGWNPDEFAMFGTKPEAEAYAQAAEWIEIVNRLYESNEPLDFDGRYYHLAGAVSRPASVQHPRPVTINAAFGPPGRDFATKYCDFLLTSFSDMADGAKHVVDISGRAAKTSRDVGIITIGHVVCRETQAEAEAYYQRYSVDHADTVAVDYHVRQKMQFSGENKELALAQYRQRFAGGTGSFPLIGTPQQIVDHMVKIHQLGYAGIAVSFLNYVHELPFFCDCVLPLMREAGLRQDG